MRPAPKTKAFKSHVIHSDGSYSNIPTAEVVETKPFKKPEVKRPQGAEIFKTKRGSQYQAVHLLDHGVYVYGYPYNYQPRVEDCDFWDWEKYEEEMG